MRPEDVNAEIIVADDARGPGRGPVTTLRLSWRRADPLAVRLSIASRPDHPSLPSGEWVVLRDALRRGLHEPTGPGDVRMEPEADGQVSLRLVREGRSTWAVVAAGPVRVFLDRTEALVAIGDERSEDAVDTLIEALLRA